MWKNGTLASPAVALASNVLPVPGAPISKTPRGIFAPMSKNFFGLFKKSTISFNSSFASLRPATSLKVTFSSPGANTRAPLRPKVNACMVPAFACRNMNQKNKAIKAKGKMKGKRAPSQKRNPEGCFTMMSVAASFSESTP